MQNDPLFGSFGSVFRAPLPAIANALGVEHTTNDVVADARKVFDAPAPDQHDRVLLEIVAFARDVTRHFELIGETNARHLAQRRIRLFRRRGVDARTDPPLLRAGLHGRHLVPLARLLPWLADQLLYRRHLKPSSNRYCGRSPYYPKTRVEPASSKKHGLSPRHLKVGKAHD